jgi:hypothetical protein
MDTVQALFDNLPDCADPRLVRASLLGLGYLEMGVRFGMRPGPAEAVRSEILCSLVDTGVAVLDCAPNDILQYAANEMGRIAREGM